MKVQIILLFVFCSLRLTAQQESQSNRYAGTLSLGMRNTLSTFTQGNQRSVGMGVGGQFRLQLDKKINTEWFGDIIKTSMYNKATRVDYHIGWSVMYYGFTRDTAGFTRLFKPYLLAGHCFDYTHVSEINNNSNYLERWSSAVQTGMGTHLNLSPAFDISLLLQYMIHLGSDIETRISGSEVILEKHKGVDLEGHLLFTVSVNCKIARLW